MLVAFEAMAVAAIMPLAVANLHGLAAYPWAFAAFLAASLVGMVAAGQLGDARGPRLPFLLGVSAFVVGLLMAGTAQTMTVFVLARAVQGVGGGLNIVAIYVVVGRAYPEALRPQVFSAMSGAWVLPSLIGPALAGTVADRASWRWVFLAVAVLVVPAVALMWPRLPGSAGPARRGAGGRVRLGLAALAAAGAAALQYAGEHPGWAGAALLVGAGALLAVSVPRLLPAGTLRARPGLPTVVLLRGLFSGAFAGAESFLPLMLVQQRGLSAAAAGLALSGGAMGWAAGSWWQGRPGLRTSRHLLLRAGALAVATGILGAGLALLPQLPAAVAAPVWTVAGAGMGLGMASVSVLVLSLADASEHGSSSAALQMSDALGAVVFIAVAGTLYTLLRVSPGHSAGAFAAIFVAMAVVALGAAGLAGRVREPPAPALPGSSR